MMIFPLQATAAEGQEKGVQFKSHNASPPIFSVSADCDAVLSWPIIIVFLWAK